MSCECKDPKLCPERTQGCGAWENYSYTRAQSESTLNPTLKEGEVVMPGDAVYLDAGELTTIYAAGLPLVGISHSCADDSVDLCGDKTIGVFKPTEDSHFTACFNVNIDDMDEAVLVPGNFYAFDPAVQNVVDAASMSPTNTGNLIKLVSIKKVDECCVAGVFATCC